MRKAGQKTPKQLLDKINFIYLNLFIKVKNVHKNQNEFECCLTLYAVSEKNNTWYRREGAQNFDPVLGCERVRGVQGGEVGKSSGRVSWCPGQDVTQLWRVRVNGVPRHQELRTTKNK